MEGKIITPLRGADKGLRCLSMAFIEALMQAETLSRISRFYILSHLLVSPQSASSTDNPST